MNSKLKLFFGALISLGISLSINGQHFPPSGNFTTTLDFPATFQDSFKQDFRYQSEAVQLHGIAIWKPLGGSLHLQGEYTSFQGLEAGVNLAYQIYDANNELLLKDGARSAFAEGNVPQEAKAKFDYMINLQELESKKNSSSFTIQFNYVKEFEYWADQKFPDIELPALKLNGIKVHKPINVHFSWIPWLAPKGIATYSLHSFTVDPLLESAANYKPSIEGYSLENRIRQENKRYTLSREDLGSSTTLLAEMKFKDAHRYNRRLGFVLEGVRWHNRSNDSYNSTWVLPLWLYSAITLVTMGIIAIVMHLVAGLKNRLARISGNLAAGMLCVIFLLEFLTPLLPFFLASFAVLYSATKCVRVKYAAYWIVVFAMIAQDFIWVTLQDRHSFHLYGLAYTLFLAPLLAAPIVLCKKDWVAIAVSNIMLVAASSYYITINLYYEFFNDYPTWNLLTYASQGIDVADSIVSLLDERHTIVIIAILFYFVALNASSRIISTESSHPKKKFNPT